MKPAYKPTKAELLDAFTRLGVYLGNVHPGEVSNWLDPALDLYRKMYPGAHDDEPQTFVVTFHGLSDAEQKTVRWYEESEANAAASPRVSA